MDQEHIQRYSYPDYFPEGCPDPENVDDREREVFRIIKEQLPMDKDFMSYKELGKSEGCRACGVSVYESLEAAKHRLKIQPSLGSHIARGQIGGEVGVHRLTSQDSGHICWWPYVQVDRIRCFPEVV